jgi:UDPglucose 6-dehydrogenase
MLAVIGAGYLGLVQAAYLAESGHTVVVYDQDKNRIAQLKKGELPIIETDLNAIFLKCFNSFIFLEKIEEFVELLRKIKTIFICVSTPFSNEKNSLDIDNIVSCLKLLDNSKYEGETICRSTLRILDSDEHLLFSRLSVVISPEFLRESTAVQDLFLPNRLIFGYGCHPKERKERLKLILDYYPRLTPDKIVITDYSSAIISKLAANSFLAMKLSFINSISMLLQKTGGNIVEISRALSLDSRISTYLQAGVGYGGGCLPKDSMQLKSLLNSKFTESENILASVIKINARIESEFVEYIYRNCENIDDKNIGILGITFKEGTDDLREAKPISIGKKLLELGAKQVLWYDPLYRNIVDKMKRIENLQDLVDLSDILIVTHPSKEVLNYKVGAISTHKDKPSIFDACNILKQENWSGWNIYRYGIYE